MSKGDDYAHQLDDILTLLYDRGAITVGDAVKLREIQDTVELDDAQGLLLIHLLAQQGFVERVGYKVYRLTARGFEAARVAAESRDQPSGGPGRPLGFRKPGQREGASDRQPALLR